MHAFERIEKKRGVCQILQRVSRTFHPKVKSSRDLFEVISEIVRKSNSTKDGINKSINAPIKKFINEDFEAGIWIFSTLFDLEKPPYKVNGGWEMKVDGVILTKTSSFASQKEEKSYDSLMNDIYTVLGTTPSSDNKTADVTNYVTDENGNIEKEERGAEIKLLNEGILEMGIHKTKEIASKNFGRLLADPHFSDMLISTNEGTIKGTNNKLQTLLYMFESKNHFFIFTSFTPLEKCPNKNFSNIIESFVSL